MNIVSAVLYAVLMYVSLASAWQIRGKVTDIHGVAISDAQVCVNGITSTNCVTSATNGTFSISGTATGSRPDPAIHPVVQGFVVDMREGKLFLDAPFFVHAQIEWFNAVGCCLSKARKIDLSKGANRLDPIPSQSGVLFLRLSAGTLKQTWRLTMSGVVDHGTVLVAPQIDHSALLKDAAISVPVLTVTKTGFKSRKYYATDSLLDTLAGVILATIQDSSTYKLPGTSYPAAAVPPNQLQGQGAVAQASGYYGGAKVWQILGYTAGNCCGAVIFNNIFAPKDSTYTCTWSVFCGLSDNMGDNCPAPWPNTYGGGCRPMQFTINGVLFPTTWHMPCRQDGGGWGMPEVALVSGLLPLKAGMNSIRFWSSLGQDGPDIDRLIVDDGRTY